MTTIETKAQILEDAGYSYSFDREIYINRKVRKVFSLDFVEDKDENTLRNCVEEPVQPDLEWRFYFNTEPSPRVRRDLSAVLG